MGLMAEESKYPKFHVERKTLNFALKLLGPASSKLSKCNVSSKKLLNLGPKISFICVFSRTDFEKAIVIFEISILEFF